MKNRLAHPGPWLRVGLDAALLALLLAALAFRITGRRLLAVPVHYVLKLERD